MTDEPVTSDHVHGWRDYIGRSETRRQTLDPETLRRFAAAVGADLDVERQTPPLAHWAYFLDVAAPDAIGGDGHPRRGGGLMPPVTLPRRMFAASALRYIAPLRLGRDAELSLTVADVKQRSGRTGALVFVELDRVVSQDGLDRVRERQTIVYRGLGERQPAIAPAEMVARSDAEIWRPGPVDLFRFSAVTFNAHRIHYDQAYATAEEGYPALVVQGPFAAVKLHALAARSQPDRELRGFSFRANAPLFVDQPVLLAPGAATGSFDAIRCDGALAMSASVDF